MPSPQEILADPNFNALPIGERLKVMRTVDPVFAGLPPKDQGTVLYQSAASFHPASDTESQPAPDHGFWSTIGHDIMALPGGIAHAVMNPGDTLANATQARLALRPKAAQALKEGNLSGAAGYGLASVMPFVGPMAAQAGEELGGGQPGQGAAHSAELLAPFLLKRLTEIPTVQDAAEGARQGVKGAKWKQAIPAAIKGAKETVAARRDTLRTPSTEYYNPPIGEGASPRPVPPPPTTQGPMRGPDWWEAYQQELRSQPPPQEPYYPPPPEPTYIEPPPPPAAVAAPAGPRLPEGWEPTIPDYLKPGAETAEQMATRHEAEAAAANTVQARTMSGDDIISMDLHGKPYAKLTPGQRDDVALYKKIVPQAVSQPTAAVAPSVDAQTAQATGGAYKKFAQAPEAVQKKVSAAAPPAVAPPPGMPAEPPAPSVIPRYASTDLKPNSQFPPVEHIPSRYRAPNGEVSVSERIAHKKDVQIAEYLLSPESGVKIETPEDWNRLPLSEKNRIAGEAYIKYGGNPKFAQKGTTDFGANYRPGQQRSISGRSADVGIDHVYQTLKELMVPPPPQ